MRALLSTIGAIGFVMCFFPSGLGAQGQQEPSAGAFEQNQLPTISLLAQFEGAESRNCPTGAGMFTLMGSRAIFTIPQIPPISKDQAVPTDIDGDFFGDSIFRVSVLPDRSGKRCTKSGKKGNYGTFSDS
jgi:hypothetical protein